MSHTHPHEAHHVKKGGYIMIKDFPCKIVEIKTSKTGKHGHAKCNITGVDVLTGRKYNEVHPGHIILDAFDRIQMEYDVSHTEGAEDDFVVHAMDEEGNQEQFATFFSPEVAREVFKKINPTEGEDDDKAWKVSVVYAPVGDGDKRTTKSVVTEIK